MKNIFVSIITASYNSEKTIANTIQSVLDQDFSNFEYIIIDGKSSDRTMELVESYANAFAKKKIEYKWISEKDSGIYDAWNKGVRMAEGNWIAFLGSDDIYLNNAISLYYKHICSNKLRTYDLVHSEVQVKDGNNIIKTINGTWSWKVFRRYMNVAHVGAFHHHSYFNKYGLFDEHYKICGDYELLLRAKENLSTLKFDTLTAKMGYGGVSNRLVAKAFRETFNAKRKTAHVSFSVCILDYFIAAFKYQFKMVVYAISR